MNMHSMPAERLAALFACAENCHYVGTPGPEPEPGKKRSYIIRPDVIRTQVGSAEWQTHLAGREGLVLVPVREDGTSVFGAVDIDAYDESFSHADLVAEVERRKLPLVVCRSKSGGAHLYLFLSEPAPASAVRAALRVVAASIGHADAEVFPKQDRINDDGNASGINVPYLGGEETDRYGVKPGGLAMTLGEFLRCAEERRASTDVLRALAATGKKQAPEPAQKAGPATPADAERRLAMRAESVVKAAANDANNKLTSAAFDLARYCRDAGLNEETARATMLRAWRARKGEGRKEEAEFDDVWRREFAAGQAKGSPARAAAGGLPVIERVQRIVDDDETTFRVQVEGQEVVLTPPELADQTKFNVRCLGQINRMFPVARSKNDWIACGATINVRAQRQSG